MGVLQLLQTMHAEGTLSSKQLDVLSAIHKKERFSLHQELRSLIYAGVLLVILGAGLTVKTYFAELGHSAVINWSRVPGILHPAPRIDMPGSGPHSGVFLPGPLP